MNLAFRLSSTLLIAWLWVVSGIALAHTVPVGVQLSFVATKAPFGTTEGEQYTDVWAEGNHAYIGSVNSGVAVVDLSAGMQHVGSYAPTGHADFQDVKVAGGVGYFSGGHGTDVVNVLNPAAPAALSRIDASVGGHASARNVAIGHNALFQVADDSPQIHVFNIANPAAPAYVRTINTQDPIGLFDVTLSGNRLFAAGLGGATYVYDVSNVSTQPPPLTASIPTGANTSSVWPMSGGNTLIATHRELGGELSAWDASSLAHASLIQSVDPSDLGFQSYSTSEVIVVDSMAYVAWYQGGLEVIDLDQLATTGMQRAGFYVVCCSSVFEGYVGVRSVFPFLGPERILISHTRYGLYVIDATAALPPLAGDYDQNGTVDVSDYALWKSTFGLSFPSADGSGNGIVDAADYVVWRKAMGASGAESGFRDYPIPEPVNSVLILMVAVAIAACRPFNSDMLQRRAKP